MVLTQLNIEQAVEHCYTHAQFTNLYVAMWDVAMLSKKTESAKNFLKSLEDPGITVNLMNDRMDTEILQVISNYSDLIFKIKDKTKVPDKDILSCAMILGYLLKSHVDRYEISESLNDIN